MVAVVILTAGPACGQRPAAHPAVAAASPEPVVDATVAPAPLPTPTPPPPALTRPTVFAIPKLGITANVESVPWLGVPTNPANVGWFQTGPSPGEQGAAVFDGHLDWTTGPAVFWQLKQIAMGDRINVTGPEGTISFAVDRVEVVDVTTPPPAWLYDVNGPPAISVITCDGAYSSRVGYNQRLLVHAVPSTT